KKLCVFEKEENMEKFNPKSKLSFEDGSKMSTWFYRTKDLIKNCGSQVSKEVLNQFEQYNKKDDSLYLINADLDKINEFANEQSIDKFDKKTIMNFNDGTSMSLWFNHNKALALNNLMIKKQYNIFINKNTLNLNENYNQKLRRFCIEENLDKFNSESTLYFEDLTLMGKWFNVFKEAIFSRNDKISDKLKKQYNQYTAIALKLTGKEKEFLDCPNLFKFSQSKNNKFVFSDNSKLSNWWKENSVRIITSDDEKYDELKNQYKLFKTKKFTLNHLNSVIRFNEFKSEFRNETNIDKFKHNTTFLFKNGSKMNSWWDRNRVVILNSNDEDSEKIKKQYEEYKIASNFNQELYQYNRKVRYFDADNKIKEDLTK
ncbi:MAG: hypothetical protein RSB54_03065, partial [Bacilli bacterium]